MRLAGLCVRHSDEVGNKLVLLMPTDGNPNRGRRRKTYIGNLLQDTEPDSVQELRTIMEDRELWKYHVNSILERPNRRRR